MKPLVSQLWPQFMADPDFAACFGQVIVEHARMLRQDRQVEFTLRSAAPLDQNLCARLLASLQPDYEGFELKIKNLFGYAMLDEHALRTLLEDMKRDGVPINGFLDRSSISITGQNITVGVCHGTKFLQEMGFEELLAKRIAEHTGVTPKVTLQSAVTAAEQQQMIQPKFLGDLIQCLLTHHRSAQLGQLSLRHMRVTVKYIICRYQTQYGIAKKLQAFVVLDMLIAMLIGIRRMRHCRRQQSCVVKLINQFIFFH